MDNVETKIHDFWQVLKKVYKSEVMQQFNLYAHGEMVILLHLLHHQGELTLPSEMSKATEISPARVAAILKSLEKKGYVRRKMNLEDRRQIFVEITKEGEEKAQLEKKRAFGRLGRIFEAMGTNEVEKLIDSMQNFHDTASQLYRDELEKGEHDGRSND